MLSKPGVLPPPPPAKALVICPTQRPGVPGLHRRVPLALTPCLGGTVLDCVITFLATRGATEVLILADDRPEMIRAAVSNGDPWGVKATVIPETRELSVEEARAKYQKGEKTGWLASPDILLLDRIPYDPDRLLWEGYTSWFEALNSVLVAVSRERVGMRELSPGVFAGMRCRIAPSAKLQPPCWIGHNVWIGPNAVIGPRAILEDQAFIDDGAEVFGSLVGPNTYVGALMNVRDSLAWGNYLLNLVSGSTTEVADDFMLGEVHPAPSKSGGSLGGRLCAVLVMLFTWPVLLAALARKAGAGQPLFVRKEAAPAVRAPINGGKLVTYWQLSGFQGIWSRWPQLWSIARGDFAWVGNRPITCAQAVELVSAFDQLWLAVPTGLFSLADVMGCGDGFTEESRVHSSFYAADPNPRKNRRIILTMISRAFSRNSS